MGTSKGLLHCTNKDNSQEEGCLSASALCVAACWPALQRGRGNAHKDVLNSGLIKQIWIYFTAVSNDNSIYPYHQQKGSMIPPNETPVEQAQRKLGHRNSLPLQNPLCFTPYNTELIIINRVLKMNHLQRCGNWQQQGNTVRHMEVI